MTERIMPRYPIYIPSKGRYDASYTATYLRRDDVPFYLVVEPSEAALYAETFGTDCILELPWNGDDEVRKAFCEERKIENGGLIAVRNWIKEHATALGADRHWQLDDNMRGFFRWFRGKRIPCTSAIALRVCEDFADRYENVGIIGPNYRFLATQGGKQPKDPFWLNVHVYSATLFLNSLPYRWRIRYNDDTDMCLQVLAGGYCTVSVNAFMVDKIRTMVVKGGNTADLYQGDGRLKMARALERKWPGIVTTSRKFQRPQHVVKGSWRGFDTPLRRKADVNFSEQPDNDYGLELRSIGEVKSARLREIMNDAIVPEKANNVT
jgi:hypothetical protein